MLGDREQGRTEVVGKHVALWLGLEYWNQLMRTEDRRGLGSQTQQSRHGGLLDVTFGI